MTHHVTLGGGASLYLSLKVSIFLFGSRLQSLFLHLFFSLWSPISSKSFACVVSQSTILSLWRSKHDPLQSQVGNRQFLVDSIWEMSFQWQAKCRSLTGGASTLRHRMSHHNCRVSITTQTQNITRKWRNRHSSFCVKWESQEVDKWILEIQMIDSTRLTNSVDVYCWVDR